LKTPTSLAAVVSNPEGHVDRALLLSGRLTDLCTKKGCWTVLADGEHSVRVRFQDYGFFLPQDALGSRALVEGRAELRTLSEREARHYAEESRDGDPDAIDGPQSSPSSRPGCACFRRERLPSRGRRGRGSANRRAREISSRTAPCWEIGPTFPTTPALR
jgi:hypothetical protein